MKRIDVEVALRKGFDTTNLDGKDAFFKNALNALNLDLGTYSKLAYNYDDKDGYDSNTRITHVGKAIQDRCNKK